MRYLTVWKILEESVVDFREEGIEIPEEIMRDLKSARTLARVSETGSNQEEIVRRIDEYIRNVESYLVSEGQKVFGPEYVDSLFRRLGEAAIEISVKEKEENRYVAGVPHRQKWIRVKPSFEIPIERLKILIEESSLSYNLQDDGHVLAYGESGNVKALVRKMRTKHG